MKEKVKMEKMIIRQQSLEEMQDIYYGMLVRHFPADEIKPFWRIKESWEQGAYIGYGLYESAKDKECLAYAWMCRIPGENWILLDYYAVTEKLRGKGMGSRFLKKIFEEYTQGIPVIIEVEDPDRIEENPDIQPEEEKEKRLRRISFYLKNGVRETDLRACVFQVHYSIMVYLNEKKQDQKNPTEENLIVNEKDREEDARNVVPFDRESLKRAYYYFYSHVPGSVEIS